MVKITKQFIKECIDLYRNQYERDREFEENFAKYFTQARGVFGHTEDYEKLINKLWLALIEGINNTDSNLESWLEWYCLECHFGKEKMSAYLDEIEYKITNDDDFADFVLKYIEYNKKSKKK